MKKVTISTALAAGLALGGAAAADTIRWQVPQGVSTSLSVVGEIGPWMAERLRILSRGDIDLRIAEPGAVIPALAMFDAVSDGTVDAGFTWSGWERGTVPAAPLFGGWPFGLESQEFVAWMMFHGGQELMEEVFHPFNVHPILCGTFSPETGSWFNREVTSLEDLQGVRFRAAGLVGDVLTEFGMSVSLLPGGEIFTALETGVIDGAEFWVAPADEQFGFAQVAPYLKMPGWHGPKTSKYLYINLDVWEGLSEHTQAMFETVCMAGTMRGFAHAEALSGGVLARFEDMGVEREFFDDEQLLAFYEATQRVFTQIREEDEMFDRVLTSLEDFKAEVRPWREMGWLQRDWMTRIGLE